MRSIRKLLICSLVILTLICSTVVVNANTSTLWVSAGGSTYTSSTDFQHITNSHSYCHIQLSSFKFTGYSENVMPLRPDGSKHYIHARLYQCSSDSTHYIMSAAMNTAHFTQASSPGYDYAYYSGYGAADTYYRLKTNSSFEEAMYRATFIWYAYT